jgi:hypothetical protein
VKIFIANRTLEIFHDRRFDMVNARMGRDALMQRDAVKALPILEFSDIREAPTKPGKEFGWCVIAPGGDDKWTIAHWNGEGWFGADGLPREPQVWAILPDLPDDFFC